MSKKAYRKRKQPGKNPVERTILVLVLVITLGSFGMLIYSHLTETDGTIWLQILISVLTGMGGFLIGTNRSK